MSSILDIDFDYFAILNDPVMRLKTLLEWGDHPVDTIVNRHHEVLKIWDAYVSRNIISPPTYILHVDEHHDMMDEKQTPNIANFLFHAMRKWPDCKVFWLVDNPIDYPDMWLSEDIWKTFSVRFESGSKIPCTWPTPVLVSACISTEFIHATLRHNLLKQIDNWNEKFNNAPP